MLLKGILKY